MEKYNFKKIEAKWQKEWEEKDLYKADDKSKKEKYYCLVEFPYPSGEGLHVGHPRSYTAMDIISRKRRMEGYNVLYPIGWDAFGLPAENYAIKTGIHPSVATKKNIETFRRQLKSLGFSFDWSREVNTTDPEYYKWTQWMFLKFFEHGMAYKDKIAINWCPKDKIGLANEEVVNGKCERCGAPVEKRMKEQWMIAITKYAERLLRDLETVDYLPQIKEQQKNWIGKSVGAKIKFEIVPEGGGEEKNINLSKNVQHSSRTDADLTRTDAEIDNNKLLYKDLTYKIRGAIFTIKKQLGLGHKEDVYHEALEIEFAKIGLSFESKKNIDVKYDNKKVGVYQPDFIIEDKVLIELKALPEIGKPQLNQTWTYLKGNDYKLALLVNFGSKELQIKRMVYETARNVPRESASVQQYSATSVEVFTTRPGTLFGATYMVLAPEHELLKNHELRITNYEEVEKYIKQASKKSDLERSELQKEKTGIELKGVKAINPATKEEIPIWVADYVLASYGTGAIMAVPAHDERDFEFAKKYNLPIKHVVEPEYSILDISEVLFVVATKYGEGIKTLKYQYSIIKKGQETRTFCFVGEGTNINSDFINGLKTSEAKEKIINWLEKEKIGKREVNYKLRDWVFSRQRYWGEPIPLVHCDKCATKKPKFLFLHGFKGTSRGDFWLWLKEELEKKGFEVRVPDLPNTNEPNLEEQMKFVLDNFKIDENTIVITHSLGGVLAMELFGQGKAKAQKLIMVAPPLKTEFKDGKDRPALNRYCDWKFNFSKIKKQVGEIKVILDKEDDCVSPYQPREIAEKLGAELIETVAHSPHFNCPQAPAVLDSILTSDVLNPGWVSVPEKDLPVKLPEVKKYEPTDTGESPLANVSDWVNTKCPKCGGPAKRETDTMPNWAGSSWYFLRYTDPENNKEFADEKKLKYWMPVDWYNGGMEHTTLHLLYSRFWYKFLYDIGEIPEECGNEPYKKRTSQGLILGEGGEKMSKSRGNVVNPDEMVKEYGADSLRLYEMFMGPFDQHIPWDTNGLIGCQRFLNKVWNLQEKVCETKEDWVPLVAVKFDSDLEQRQNIAIKKEINNIEKLLHQTIKKVSEDIEEMKFNTAIAQMMTFINSGFPSLEELINRYPELKNQLVEQTLNQILVSQFKNFLILLAPFAPHIAEEIWSNLGNKKSIHLEKWPDYDESLIKEEKINLVVQINGKLRDTIKVAADISEEEAKKLAMESEKIKKHLTGKPKKVIFVPGKLVNIVI